jgi:hypothetical protein
VHSNPSLPLLLFTNSGIDGKTLYSVQQRFWVKPTATIFGVYSMTRPE